MATAHPVPKLPGTDPLVTPPALGYLENSVMFRKSGLLFARGLAFHRWELIGSQLLSITDSTTWWVADWIAYGERTFQDRYREAIQETSLNYQTLRNYVWVARRFNLSRRRDCLSFGHHAEVAALDQPEQDYWLRKAEELKWSRNQLRSEVRNSLQQRKTKEASLLPRNSVNHVETADGLGGLDAQSEGFPSNTEAMILSLHLTTRQFTRFRKVANSQNQQLEEWARQVLETAANCIAPRSQKDMLALVDQR